MLYINGALRSGVPFISVRFFAASVTDHDRLAFTNGGSERALYLVAVFVFLIFVGIFVYIRTLALWATWSVGI